MVTLLLLHPDRGKALGIEHLRRCERKSYSGPLIVHPDTHIRPVHCNGRHPNLPEGDQDVIYLMTCTLLSALEELKVLIREGISKLYPRTLSYPPTRRFGSSYLQENQARRAFTFW